ncbi:MAG: 50S ribosomal protein L6 [Candidatus Sumerlaeota bacterium]|nr:50S ribosomal protein L6 [Candidatus Sumerlaeota bacterium]
MSRIGKIPIQVPKEVKLTLDERKVTVQGPKGTLFLECNDKVALHMENNQVLVKRFSDDKASKASHGLYQRLIINMITGVTKGYRKELEIVGVGYRAQMEGSVLTLQVGLSHIPQIVPPEGINISVPKPTQIIIEGSDKQKVGQVAAEIRKVRPPEPYQGKGIRYTGERVRRKVGKAGTK